MRKYIYIFVIIFLSIYLSSKTLFFQTRPNKFFRFNSDLSNDTNEIRDMIKPFISIFKESGISPAESVESSNIIFFHLITDYRNKYLFLHNVKKHLYIYSLLSVDLLASKSSMYEILMFKNPIHLVNKFTPKTFLIKNEKLFKKFKTNFDPKKKYILKNNNQKQKGCIITNDIEYISDNYTNYVVIQELLQNPYTVNGHKINIRMYLLFTTKDTSLQAYLFEDGFIYYTPEIFEKNSLSHEKNITTGYIDREIYRDNPLTYKDFLATLSNDEQSLVRKNIFDMFTFICNSFKSTILKYDNNHHTKFLLFGCDVAIDNKLRCKIMEMNKGPDLSYKDTYDSVVKFQLVKSTAGVLKIIQYSDKNFIRLC